MRFYVTLNGARFRGYGNSLIGQGYKSMEAAKRACDDMAQSWPFGERNRRNVWAIEAA